MMDATTVGSFTMKIEYEHSPGNKQILLQEPYSVTLSSSWGGALSTVDFPLVIYGYNGVTVKITILNHNSI